MWGGIQVGEKGEGGGQTRQSQGHLTKMCTMKS